MRHSRSAVRALSLALLAIVLVLGMNLMAIIMRARLQRRLR